MVCLWLPGQVNLTGESRAARLHDTTMALCCEMLLAGGLASNPHEAHERLLHVLDSGLAAEVFGRMVAEMGGPSDFVENYKLYLEPAPLVRALYSPRSGYVHDIDTRGLGMAVCALGGGRRRALDELDYRVGLSDMVELGQQVSTETPLALVHAADEAGLEEAERRVREAITLSSNPTDRPQQICCTLRAGDLVN